MSGTSKGQNAETQLAVEQRLDSMRASLASRGEGVAQASDRLARALPAEQQVGVLSLLRDFVESTSDGGAPERIAQALATRAEESRGLDTHDLERWLNAHSQQPDQLLDCITVRPPEYVRVIQQLSQKGMQKKVYVATWAFEDRERPVMLKQFIGQDAATKVMPREMAPHPLSMQHPNIIETHLFFNDADEPFLVERRLPLALDETWSPGGALECANLLHDISAALGFIHSRDLVHGDLKPDNIGFERERYILLDFGVCRPAKVFMEAGHPSGEHLVRAPELLSGQPNTPRSDVWAIGASVFNAIAGRYPLAERGDLDGRASPEEREVFQETLAHRAANEWHRWVSDGLRELVPHERLAHVLRCALEHDPTRRPRADDLVRLCRRELSALVRATSEPAGMSPSQRLEQLDKFLPATQLLSRMPAHRRLDVQKELDELDELGLVSQEQETLRSLRARIADVIPES